jgi:cobalt-zinc-cadmium efflux system outer membrane protein
MYRKHVWFGLCLVALAGCYTRVRPEVDGLVCNSVGRQVDYMPPALDRPAVDRPTAPAPAPAVPSTPLPKGKDATKGPEMLPPLSPRATLQSPTSASEKVPNTVFDHLLQTSTQSSPNIEQQQQQGSIFLKRVEVPPGLPGSESPPISLPTDPEKYKAAVAKYLPPLPAIGPDPQPVPGPGDKPLTLEDLQRMGRSNSPLLRQAASDVAAAKGAAIQAGAYNNPTAGVQSATHSQSGGPSYGFILGQTITTMGKKKLAEAAAIMDLENAQLAYHRAETDLMSAIRTGYFQVLVAEKAMQANRALVNLTDEIYKVNVDQMKGGEAAVYEPMQVAVFAAQARQGLIQARNSYTLAWKQLAASLGRLGMKPTQLAGSIDMPLPKYDYDKVLAQVLTKHTDVMTAANGELKARYNLRLAEVTAVPDVTVSATLTNDNTLGVNNNLVMGLQTTVPVPVWDRNLGGIQQARGVLLRAVEEHHRVQNDLAARVADAFRRYDENRDLLDLYRQEILPKQVQAYRAAVARYYRGEFGRLAYTDVITAEQNLVSVIGPYITALGAQWQAVVDVAGLLQTEDLFQANGVFPVAPVPNLEALLQLPCCHPCSTLPGSIVPAPDFTWPAAGFQAKIGTPQ